MKSSLRAALVVVSIVAIGSTTSAVTDLGALDPANAADLERIPTTAATGAFEPPASATTDAATIAASQESLQPQCPRLPNGDCSASAPSGQTDRATAPEELLPEESGPPEESVPPDESVPTCVVPGDHSPHGTTTVVPGAAAATGSEVTIRFRVEIEDGLAVDGRCFAAAVTSILQDDRGWAGTGVIGFSRVDDGAFDFRLILASPTTTNALCYPAATGSKYSCRNRDKVVLNLERWVSGTVDFSGDLDIYRRYLVNHEVGHLLGEGHRDCPAAGSPAPVMMQQTKGIGECTPNGWPTADER